MRGRKALWGRRALREAWLVWVRSKTYWREFLNLLNNVFLNLLLSPNISKVPLLLAKLTFIVSSISITPSVKHNGKK